jgi:Fe-S-cluster containining protein
LKYQNVILPEHVGFTCKNCGRCCKEQSADVTAEEQNQIEQAGFKDFLDENDLSEPRLIKSRKDGGCFFFNSHSCVIQEVKPAICRLVPFMVVDWDYERDVIEVDLPADCDCPGVLGGDQLPVDVLVTCTGYVQVCWI